MRTSSTTPRGQAAAAYFMYGVVYLWGAVRELDASRMRDFFGGTTPWWVFYGVGGIFVVLLPVLVARGHRYLAGMLAVLTGVKALYLFYGLGREFDPFNLGFALVALVASVFLGRAFMRPGVAPSSESAPSDP